MFHLVAFENFIVHKKWHTNKLEIDMFSIVNFGILNVFENLLYPTLTLLPSKKILFVPDCKSFFCVFTIVVTYS